MQIEFEIDGMRLTRTSDAYLIEGSENFVECVFSFSSDWNELDKWALFKRNNNTYEIFIENNKCLVPIQCTSAEGEFTISVVGRKNAGSVTGTASDKLLTVRGSEFVGGMSEEGRLTETYLVKVLAEVKALHEKTATSEANAAQSAKESADSAAAALQSEKNAKASEKAAETSKEAAAQSEANSKTSEDAARGYADDAEASKGATTALAVNAAASANAAAESAKQAALSESNAKTSETESEASAQSAAQSKADAEQSKLDADKSKTEATTEATKAASSAAQAQESAALATQKAGEASNSAEQSETERAAAEMAANRAAEYAANVVENSGRYTAGVKFTPTESAGARLDMAESMVWEKSTDLIAGRDDFPTKFNCFNTYEALVKGGKIVATEGSYEFEKYKDDDEYDADVFVMFPKGYGRRYIDGEGNEYRYISDKKLSGYVPSPLHFVENTEYNVVGITKYGWCDNGSGGICSRAGKPKRASISWQDFETKSVARGAGIHAMSFSDVTWLQHLGCIKYANRNWQSVVGNGVIGGFTDAALKKCTVTQASSASIIIDNATAENFAVGEPVYLVGTTVSEGIYTRKILSISVYDDNNKRVSVDGPAFATTAGTSGFYRAVNYSGETDAILGLDGEISGGTSGRNSVKILGLENFFANDWKLLGNAMRIGNDVYINPKPLSASAWPTSANDAIAKGWIHLDNVFANTSGYIKTLSYSMNYPLISLPATVGGDSQRPVGDYFSTSNDTTGLELFQFGGSFNVGSYCGPFYVAVDALLYDARFHSGAFGVFRPQ